MPAELYPLLAAAVTVSVVHTVSGPDHYLPFVALARTRQWSVGQTVRWTLVCGLGHILSSVLLGLIGAAVGWSLSSLTGLENLRGGLAAWALLLFGTAYLAWGLYRLRSGRLHRHVDLSEEGAFV
ncbi:MAG TPA: hypothetical protein VHK69_04495, partial [Chitinophagaceae bacterium]|nr:hypothetical protein [Chitinophagaceae bacterium]